MESPICERRAWRAIAVAAVLVAASGARTAHAAPAPPAVKEDARETARARLVEGVELLRQKQFAQALTKFDDAYALVPSPNIFYDRGLAYQGLGREADALGAFDSFLAHADHAPPGTREKATRERDVLRARVATLAVASDPPGAEITVDGQRRGVTPLGDPLYIDVGPHEVAARQPSSGVITTERIVAAPRETVRLTLRFSTAEAQASPARSAPALARAAWPTPASALVDTRRSSDAVEPRAESRFDVPTLAFAGIGAAFLATAATFAVLGQRENDSVMRDVANGSPFDFGKDAAGRRDNTLAEVFLAAGAAAVTTSAVFFGIRESRQHAERATATRARSQALVTVGGGASLAPGFAGGRLRLTF